MDWVTVLTVLIILGCITVVVSAVVRRHGYWRESVLGAFAMLNLMAAVLVGRITPPSSVTTALQWMLLLGFAAFFVAEIREVRIRQRRERGTRASSSS